MEQDQTRQDNMIQARTRQDNTIKDKSRQIGRDKRNKASQCNIKTRPNMTRT